MGTVAHVAGMGPLFCSSFLLDSNCTTISFFSRLHCRAHFIVMSWAYHRICPGWKRPQKTSISFVAK